jgi:hypothetical protein
MLGGVTVNFILALLFQVWHLLTVILIASTDFKDGMLIENPVLKRVSKQVISFWQCRDRKI